MRLLGKKLFDISVKTKLKNNNQGQGRSWHHTAKDRKDFDKLVPEAMVLTYDDETGELSAAPFSESLAGVQLSDLVALTVTRILGKGERLWDADSVLRGSAKQLLDAIVGTGLLADDNPKYVSLVIGMQDDTQRELGPRIDVGFYETVNGKALDS